MDRRLLSDWLGHAGARRTRIGRLCQFRLGLCCSSSCCCFVLDRWRYRTICCQKKPDWRSQSETESTTAEPTGGHGEGKFATAWTCRQRRWLDKQVRESSHWRQSPDYARGAVAGPSVGTRIPGLVREHRADKANDDIRNSARTKGCVLKTSRIPRTLSALLLVELSIQGFYWIFATLAHAQNKSWCSRTNPDTRVARGTWSRTTGQVSGLLFGGYPECSDWQ